MSAGKQAREGASGQEREKQKKNKRACGVEWQPKPGMFHFRLTLQLGRAR